MNHNRETTGMLWACHGDRTGPWRSRRKWSHRLTGTFWSQSTRTSLRHWKRRWYLLMALLRSRSIAVMPRRVVLALVPTSATGRPARPRFRRKRAPARPLRRKLRSRPEAAGAPRCCSTAYSSPSSSTHVLWSVVGALRRHRRRVWRSGRGWWRWAAGPGPASKGPRCAGLRVWLIVSTSKRDRQSVIRHRLLAKVMLGDAVAGMRRRWGSVRPVGGQDLGAGEHRTRW